MERLNIQRACGQDKSNLVCLQELKGGMEGGHLKALPVLVAKRILVRSSLPESCSSLVSMLPPLMRQVPSVPQLRGDRWLDPVSEDFNMTKVMTLERGKGEAPRLCSWPLDDSAKEPSCSHATPRSRDMQLTTRCYCGLHCFPARAWTRQGACSTSAPWGLPCPLGPREIFPCVCACICCFSFLRL